MTNTDGRTKIRTLVTAFDLTISTYFLVKLELVDIFIKKNIKTK